MTTALQKPCISGLAWLAQTGPLFAGFGAGLAYVDDRLSWMAWVALVPLGWAWSHGSRSTPLAVSFLGGIIYHGMALSWLRSCYADGSEWFGPQAPAWLAISIIGAAFFVLMCCYGQYLIRVVRLPATVALPLAWLSVEIAKSCCGLFLSQTEFPWAKLGLTQASLLPMAQAADLGGELLLSGLVCVANGAIVDALGFLRRPATLSYKKLACGTIGGATLLMAAWSYGHWRLKQDTGQPGPVVCLMGELDLPPFLDRQRLMAKAGTDDAGHANAYLGQRPQLLLWSELAWHHKLVTAKGFSGGSESTFDKLDDVTLVAHGDLATYRRFVDRSLLASAAAVDAVLVLGCERLEQTDGDWRRFNSVVCVDATNQSIAHYDKRWLVPWGEYVPYALADASGTGDSYACGTLRPDFHVRCEQRTYRFRVSICYDLCFAPHFWPPASGPDDKSQVDFFVHCGSEGQDPSGALATLLHKATQLRAIEVRRAIVRNVNFGYSGIVDGNGVVLCETERKPIRAPITLPPVPVDRRFSCYARWGDWPLYVLCSTTALVVWRRRSRTTSREDGA